MYKIEVLKGSEEILKIHQCRQDCMLLVAWNGKTTVLDEARVFIAKTVWS